MKDKEKKESSVKKTDKPKKTDSTSSVSPTDSVGGKKAEKSKSQGKYIYSVGRRKEARAQVRMYSGKGKITVNNKELNNYFPTSDLQQKVYHPLELVGEKDKCDITVMVKGGGKTGQVEAIRHGIARALQIKNEDYRAVLKKEELLKRDPRMKERKKYGLKGARRAPQWQKR
jgi:small subunit ribosomal protein S9